MSLQLLEQCRQKFGPPPRSFSLRERFYLWMAPPDWMIGKRDELWRVYRSRKQLVRDGQVVWAALIQANFQLFSPGSSNCPAAVVYSTDPSFDSEPYALEEIARSLFRLKGTAPEDPALQKFAHDLTDERVRSMKLALPHSLTQGRDVFYTCIMVHRPHLPDRYLAAGLLPLVVQPELTEATLILPSRFWSDELLALWRSEGKNRPRPQRKERPGSTGR
jgi:hypothetical protein